MNGNHNGSIKNVVTKKTEEFTEYHHEDEGVTKDGEETVTLGRLEQFFGGPWNRCVFRCRYFIVLIFILWTCYAVDQARMISPLTEREKYVEDDHPIMRTLKTMEDDFITTSNSAIRVSIFWGVKDIKKGKVNRWDPADLGEVVFDEDFDLTPKEAQQSLIDFCQDLRSQKFVASGQVICWIEDFDNFIKEKYKKTR